MFEIIDHFRSKKTLPGIDPTCQVWFEVEKLPSAEDNDNGAKLFYPGSRGRAVIKFRSTIGRTISNPQIVFFGRVAFSDTVAEEGGTVQTHTEFVHYYSCEPLFAIGRSLGDPVTLSSSGNETSWMVDFQFPYHCDDKAAPGYPKMLPPSEFENNTSQNNKSSSRHYYIVEYRFQLVCSLSARAKWNQSTFMSERLDFRPYAEEVPSSVLHGGTQAKSFRIERFLGTPKHFRNPFVKHSQDPQMMIHAEMDKFHPQKATFPLSVKVSIDHLPQVLEHPPDISVRIFYARLYRKQGWHGNRMTKLLGIDVPETQWVTETFFWDMTYDPADYTVQGKVMPGNRLEYQTSLDISLDTALPAQTFASKKKRTITPAKPALEVNNMRILFEIQAGIGVQLGDKYFAESLEIEGVALLPEKSAPVSQEAPLYSSSAWEQVDLQPPDFFEYYPEL